MLGAGEGEEEVALQATQAGQTLAFQVPGELQALASLNFFQGEQAPLDANWYQMQAESMLQACWHASQVAAVVEFQYLELALSWGMPPTRPEAFVKKHMGPARARGMKGSRGTRYAWRVVPRAGGWAGR